MNLELLLSITCLLGQNNDACFQAGTAYYYHQGLDQIANQVSEKINRKYPAVVFTATLLSNVEQRRLKVPGSHGTYVGWEFPEGRESKLTCGWELGF